MGRRGPGGTFTFGGVINLQHPDILAEQARARERVRPTSAPSGPQARRKEAHAYMRARREGAIDPSIPFRERVASPVAGHRPLLLPSQERPPAPQVVRGHLDVDEVSASGCCQLNLDSA
jgi:hypothetical protein